MSNFEELPEVAYQVRSADEELSIHVPPGAWETSAAGDPRPILETTGLYACIGVAWYLPEDERAILAHWRPSDAGTFPEIEQIAANTRSDPVSVTYATGGIYGKNAIQSTEDVIEAYREQVRTTFDATTIDEELAVHPEPGSISIDARDGARYR